MHSATADVYRPPDSASLQALLGCIPQGRSVTARGGGQSLDAQSLNGDIVVRLVQGEFTQIKGPFLDENGYFLIAGAGASWGEILKATAAFGLVPPSFPTAPEATVGGTLSADCVSRMSCVYGKEGNQIRSFKIVLSSGKEHLCTRNCDDDFTKTLFNAVIGGFGYLGVVTEVTFDLVPARSAPLVYGCNPAVFTRSTRHGANPDWHRLLLSLRAKARQSRARWDESRQKGASTAYASAPEWPALSIASFLNASGISANLLEQRFVDPQPLRPAPGGVYDKDATFPGEAALTQGTFPTLVEFALQTGFPSGEFVDELFGWGFFLGNYTRHAQAKASKSGRRVNFCQQSFALPCGCDESNPDTRPMQRFIEILEARLHAVDKRPATIDFLYVPKDEFLMSASRDFPSFVVTISFGDTDQATLPSSLNDVFCALTHDCLRLGGRVHLVKNVIADRSDLRAMHGDAAAQFRALKHIYDPKNLFKNEFFSRVFEA